MSTRQMELLDQENYDDLEEVLARKGVLLNMLPAAIEAGSRLGWSLANPESYPTESGCAELIAEAADLSRRLQAHERYCLSQAAVRRNQIDDRIAVMMNRRHAASGYAVPRSRGGRLDTAR
jgi:hypothetical protein